MDTAFDSILTIRSLKIGVDKLKICQNKAKAMGILGNRRKIGKISLLDRGDL